MCLCLSHPTHTKTSPPFYLFNSAFACRPLSRLRPPFLLFCLLITSMSSTREQNPPCLKRQRTEAGLLPDDASELQPSKRLKSRAKLHSAAFYNSLSKVWLTRRALKELDRRTSKVNRPQRPASASRYVDREHTSKQIRIFARQGVPELGDLRGVKPVSKAC